MSAARVSRRDFLHGRARAPLLALLTQELAAPAPEADARAPIARIDVRRCLGSSSQVCTVCFERCGARGAITMRGLSPVVALELCTGCGECATACPAPSPAIRMVERVEPEVPDATR